MIRRLLLRVDQRLGGTHVLVAIVDAHDDYVLGRSPAIFRSFRRELEIVVLGLGVGELADWLYVLPVAGIDGIFRALDGRETVDGTERDMNLPGFDRRSQRFDARRSSVHFKAAAFF